MTIQPSTDSRRSPAVVTAASQPSGATLVPTGGKASSVTTATRTHPLREHQRAALRALIERDHLPGQPRLTPAMLTEALAGRSPIDGGWWDELTGLRTEVLTTPTGALLGGVSWGYRPSDDTAVLLWLHANEQPTAVAALLEHALSSHPGRWEAFEFASALTLGVEALPVGHRPVTAAALSERGFTGRDLWRYMHRPLRDLPPRPPLTFSVTPARLDGWELSAPGGSVQITAPLGGVSMISWLGVDETARGRGLGAALLGAALHHLAGHHATDVVLYVDDDEPGTARDRRAANRVYDRAGFRQIDRLHSYLRP